jgi:hypothetical protein
MVELMASSHEDMMPLIDTSGTNASASKSLESFLDNHFKSDLEKSKIQKSIIVMSVIGGDILHKIKSPKVFRKGLIVVDRKVRNKFTFKKKLFSG